MSKATFTKKLLELEEKVGRLQTVNAQLLEACEAAWADYEKCGDISATTLELIEEAIAAAKERQYDELKQAEDEIARLRAQQDKLLEACEDEQTALEVWASDPALPADVKEGVGISLDKIRKTIRAAKEDDDGRRNQLCRLRRPFA